MIPADLKSDIEQKKKIKILRAINISGGSINEAAKLLIENGTELFLKWNSGSLLEMFDVEVKGLQFIQQHCDRFKIPNIIGYDITDSGEISWLLLEYIDQGRTDGDFFEHFGQSLAQLHTVTHSEFGLDHDNFIGRLPQINSFEKNWITFFIEHRIEPQLKMAFDKGLLPDSLLKNFEILFKQLPDIIPEEKPALLHGDLWSGNFMATSDAIPVLIDPAVYFGHREAELAFTKLFGGFSSAFYRAYNESNPPEAGLEQRVDIFNLYPLLVHVNLFGHAYTSQVTSIIKRFES